MQPAVVSQRAAESASAETPPWWTEADHAELACLVRELVDAIFEHKGQCDRCLAHARRDPGSEPCPNVSNAVAVVVDWRERRELLSRAVWIRRKREQLEYARDLLSLRRTA